MMSIPRTCSVFQIKAMGSMKDATCRHHLRHLLTHACGQLHKAHESAHAHDCMRAHVFCTRLHGSVYVQCKLDNQIGCTILRFRSKKYIIILICVHAHVENREKYIIAKLKVFNDIMPFSTSC